jgi:hypothetical protein
MLVTARIHFLIATRTVTIARIPFPTRDSCAGRQCDVQHLQLRPSVTVSVISNTHGRGDVSPWGDKRGPKWQTKNPQRRHAGQPAGDPNTLYQPPCARVARDGQPWLRAPTVEESPQEPRVAMNFKLHELAS